MSKQKGAVRLKVIKLRKAMPDITASEIGRWLGVSRQRVSWILKKEGLPTKTPKRGARQKYICNYCGNPTPYNPKNGQYNKVFCCRECMKEYYTALVECDHCHNLFPIQYSELKRRVRRHARQNTNLVLFCDRKCSGAYYGLRHGFHAHPENRKYKGDKCQTRTMRGAEGSSTTSETCTETKAGRCSGKPVATLLPI